MGIFSSKRSKQMDMLRNVSNQTLYAFWESFFTMRLISRIRINNLPDTVDEVLIKKTAAMNGSAAVGDYHGIIVGGAYSNSGRTDMNGYPSKYVYINTLNTYGSRLKCKDFVLLYDNVLRIPSMRFVSAFAYSCYAAHTAAITNIQQQAHPYLVATLPQIKLSTDNILDQMFNNQPYINVPVENAQTLQEIKNLITTFDVKVELISDKLMQYIREQVEIFDMLTGITQPSDKRERMITMEATMGAMSSMVSMSATMEMYEKFARDCNDHGFNNGSPVTVNAVTAGIIPGLENMMPNGKEEDTDVV